MSTPNENTQQKLQELFDAEYIEIIDNSWQHAGHMAMRDVDAATGTHLAILIVSPSFEGQPLIKRHRSVQKALKEEFDGVLHALELKALTPTEWKQRQTN